jgi:hypothetical protein
MSHPLYLNYTHPDITTCDDNFNINKFHDDDNDDDNIDDDIY